MDRPVGSGKFETPDGQTLEIRDVWEENMEVEMAHIRRLVETHPYVAMDTEFPGVVARPVGSFTSTGDYQYQTLRCNVDLLKIIQLGISFADEHGRVAPDCPTWQFNFKFDVNKDMYAQDSIELLKRSGIDFERHRGHGIDVQHFGELFISSGLLMNERVKWISFHSGYDFGYLLKVLTAQNLPTDEHGFFSQLRLYFPNVYDVKHLMHAHEALRGGLNKLAEDLEVERVGPMHQAGSDSLLTAAVFFKLRDVLFDGKIDDSMYKGILYGIGAGAGVP